jgi:hypothetical protein
MVYMVYIMAHPEMCCTHACCEVIALLWTATDHCHFEVKIKIHEKCDVFGAFAAFPPYQWSVIKICSI